MISYFYLGETRKLWFSKKSRKELHVLMFDYDQGVDTENKLPPV